MLVATNHHAMQRNTAQLFAAALRPLINQKITGEFDAHDLRFLMSDLDELHICLIANRVSTDLYTTEAWLADLDKPEILSEIAQEVCTSLEEHGELIQCDQTGDFYTPDAWREYQQDCADDADHYAIEGHSSNFI